MPPTGGTGAVPVGGSGGVSATGGSSGSGGTSATGGASATGGTAATGTGATGGTGAMGGASATGGTSAPGGTSGGGGAAGSCARPVGACTAPEVTVTEVNVGIPVTGCGMEGDTDPLPMAIAAMPSGGSRLAWLGTDSHVHIAELDCNDRLVGTPFGIPAVDLQDIAADEAGGVVLVTREATNGGQDNCGNGQLCGGTSSPCRTMWMVRFNNAGSVEWETQVTNLSDSLAGYDDGARFVWWYQHHGRLAYDGTNYAAYFCIGITVQNGNCIDIHEGDRMQVVGPDGALLNHPQAPDFGCSHSWTTRILWDERVGQFVMVCATDNPCSLALSNPYRAITTATCDDTFWGGDVVLAGGAGYYTAWTNGGTIRLEHFTDGASDQTRTNMANADHAHLVGYGAGRMLLAWGSGSAMAARVLDSGSGTDIGPDFTISVVDHSFQAFKEYSDGSAAYPASGSSDTSINIARVMPCSG